MSSKKLKTCRWGFSSMVNGRVYFLKILLFGGLMKLLIILKIALRGHQLR